MSDDSDSEARSIFKSLSRDYVIPYSNSYFETDSEISDGLYQKSRRALNQAYWDEISSATIPKMWLLIGVYDYLFILSHQTYGLLTALYGSALLFVDSFHSTESLAETTFLQTSPEARLKRNAQIAAVNSEGAVALVIGFILQLFALHRPGTELLYQNIWQGQFNSMLVVVGLLVVGILPGYIREWISE